jgi:putative flippase GtrA
MKLPEAPSSFRPSNSPARLARYLTVGTLGTIVDVALFTVLSLLFGIPTLAANTVSYSAGIVNNYTLHRRWTYGNCSHKAVGRQFIQFAAISLSALALNNLMVMQLAPRLATQLVTPAYAIVIAKASATGVGMAWNYVANNCWTFEDATKHGGQL